MATVPRTTTGGRHSIYHGSVAGTRPAVLGLAKLLFLGASQISMATAAPLKNWLHGGDDEPLRDDPDDTSLWIYMAIATVLVLAGGAFAGLTIALMGQDGIYLQVIATSGEGKEQKHAQRVYRLLKRGKHWVLVTLLLANVIVNETLPIVLDRSLGGGWPAVLGSTALIVIFGEVIPQSICVRYGMQIGAYMSPYVLILMYLLAPIAWPTAKLLDWLLGEDHGAVYKKSGLKTLVTLHKTLGPSPSDRLNQDEVTIISAVLDLKDKPVGDIMTPMEDVFTMSSETVLDEKTMDTILSAGYSRIPIYEPGNESNFIGMLLVKMLITYDPEDCKKVGEFALATLPETRPETSCLDIVNFFQEGKSHMVLVSEYPGEDHGATGVVTLEDVIEELIGEEIIDESDVYIDVHKAIRRLAPAPTARRVPKAQKATDTVYPNLQNVDGNLIDIEHEAPKEDSGQRRQGSLDGRASTTSPAAFGTSPKTTFMVRRGSSAGDGNALAIRGNVNEMREHLKHLGPSNLAARPKQTRYQTVKIKPGHVVDTTAPSDLVVEEPYHDEPELSHGQNDGEGESLLRSTRRDASSAIRAAKQGYGSISPQSSEQCDKAHPMNFGRSSQALASKDSLSKESSDNLNNSTRRPTTRGTDSGSDAVASLRSGQTSPVPPKKRGVARSGSITENVVDANGVRKVVLQTASSSDGDDTENGRDGEVTLRKSKNTENAKDTAAASPTSQDDNSNNEEMKKKSRRRRKRRSPKEEEEDGPE